MTQRLTVKNVVFDILHKSNRPMHVSELTALVIRKIELKGLTPDKTVNAVCQRHPSIKRVARGTFRALSK